MLSGTSPILTQGRWAHRFTPLGCVRACRVVCQRDPLGQSNLLHGDRSRCRRQRDGGRRGGLFGMHFLTVLWARISLLLHSAAAAAATALSHLYRRFIPRPPAPDYQSAHPKKSKIGREGRSKPRPTWRSIGLRSRPLPPLSLSPPISTQGREGKRRRRARENFYGVESDGLPSLLSLLYSIGHRLSIRLRVHFLQRKRNVRRKG